MSHESGLCAHGCCEELITWTALVRRIVDDYA